MKKHFWQVVFAVVLVLLSIGFYYAHYMIFHDKHHIFIYLVGDIAFVPIEVLIVSLILHKLLEIREKKSMLRKLNMVIGTFFSEIGNDLIETLVKIDENKECVRSILGMGAKWDEKDFKKAKARLCSHKYKVSPEYEDLLSLRTMLSEKRDFMLHLLGNPNLLEHDDFTDLLWAVFHLTEELMHRKDLKSVAGSDAEHIAGDISRAYKAVSIQWIYYMSHLKEAYPYLFSLALRTNPFLDENSKKIAV